MDSVLEACLEWPRNENPSESDREWILLWRPLGGADGSAPGSTPSPAGSVIRLDPLLWIFQF